MICPNCGTQNPEGEAVCMGCKETLPKLDLPKNKTEEVKKEKKQKEKPERQKNERLKNKKLFKTIITIIILVVVVVSAVIVYRYKTKNLNANDPVLRLDTVMNSFTGDAREYAKYLLPESVASDVKSVLDQIDGSDTKNETAVVFSEKITSQYESWKDKYGDDLKISLSILYKDKMNEEQFSSIESCYAGLYAQYVTAENKSYNQLVSDIAAKYGIKEGKASKVADALTHAKDYCSTMQIQDGYDMVVRLTLEGRKATEQLAIDVFVIKVDGTWNIDMASTFDKLKDDRTALDELLLIK